MEVDQQWHLHLGWPRQLQVLWLLHWPWSHLETVVVAGGVILVVVAVVGISGLIGMNGPAGMTFSWHLPVPLLLLLLLVLVLLAMVRLLHVWLLQGCVVAAECLLVLVVLVVVEELGVLLCLYSSA